MPLFSSTAGISARALGLTSGILSGAAAITSILGNQNGTTGTQLLVYFNAGTPGSSPVTDYQYSLNGGSTWNTFASPQTSSPLTITGLTNGTTYSVAIRPMQGLQASIPSNTASGRPVALPSTPSISSITNDANGTTGTHISVAFTGGAGGTDSTTNFQFSTDNGSTWTTRSPAATSSPILITGLTNGTSYNVRVRAVTSIGDVSASSAASTGRPVALPGAPTISGITASTGQLSVAFSVGQAGTDAPSTYEYSLDGGSTWLGRQTGTTASPIVITGITDSTVANANKSLSPTYSVRIRSLTAQSHRSAASGAVTPSATLAAAPTSLVASPLVTSLSVTFTSAVAGSYAINRHEYSIDNGSTWSTYTSGQAISSLLPSTQYTVQIRAIDAQELAGATASVTATTNAEVAPSAPTITSVSSSSTTSLTVAYTNATQGTYAVGGYEYSTDGTTWTSAGASPFTISGLTQNATYTVRLRAFSSYTPSGGSALRGAETTQAGQVNPEVPPAPTVAFYNMTNSSGKTAVITITKSGSDASSTKAYVAVTNEDAGNAITIYNSVTHSSMFTSISGGWRFSASVTTNNRYKYRARVGNRLSTSDTVETSSYSGFLYWTTPLTSQAYSLSASATSGASWNGTDFVVTRTDVSPPAGCTTIEDYGMTFPTVQSDSEMPGYIRITQVQIKFKCGVNNAVNGTGVALCNPSTGGRVLKVSYGGSNGSSPQIGPTTSDTGQSTFGSTYTGGVWTFTSTELGTLGYIQGTSLSGVTMRVTLTGGGAIWDTCTSLSNSYGFFYASGLVATGIQTKAATSPFAAW